MENITASFANFWGGSLVLIFGLVLRFVQGSEGMIAGYGTMSKAEQAKWNVTEMRLFLGRVLIISALILIVAGILMLLDVYSDLAAVVSWGLFVAVNLFGVLYLNLSPRFKA